MFGEPVFKAIGMLYYGMIVSYAGSFFFFDSLYEVRYAGKEDIFLFFLARKSSCRMGLCLTVSKLLMYSTCLETHSSCSCMVSAIIQKNDERVKEGYRPFQREFSSLLLQTCERRSSPPFLSADLGS